MRVLEVEDHVKHWLADYFHFRCFKCGTVTYPDEGFVLGYEKPKSIITLRRMIDEKEILWVCKICYFMAKRGELGKVDISNRLIKILKGWGREDAV